MKLFLAIFLYTYSQITFANCPSVSEELESLIKSHAAEVAGGENCRFRKLYIYENIELAAYTIGGPCYDSESKAGSCGNNYFTSLTGIINGESIKHLTIGGKGKFHAKSVNYEDGLIKINGLAYKKGDPMCCPTVMTTKFYKVKKLEFIQVNQ